MTILARLLVGEEAIEVEQTARYELTLTNQGEDSATAQVAVQGLPESWLSFSRCSLTLTSGQSMTLVLRVTPARLAASRAGYHPFSLTVTPAEAPEQSREYEALLCVKPFYDFALELIPPVQPLPPWSGQYGQMSVSLSNQSNTPLSFRLAGVAEEATQGWRFDFSPPTDATIGPNSADLLLLAGSRQSIPLTVVPNWLSLATLTTQPRAFSLTMTRLGAGAIEDIRSARGHLTVALPSSPLLYTSLGFCAALLLALTVWLFPGSPATSSPESAPLVMVPSTNASGETARVGAVSPSPNVESVGAGTLLAEAGPLVPVIVPTAIPEAAFIALSESIVPVQEAPAETSATTLSMQPSGGIVPLAPELPAVMTYEAMFKEIGARYDLDWRLLASMAYKESSMNPIAVGRDGDMGLMQIMPPTWDQIAPQVGVSDPYDAYSNALAGAAFLRYLIDYSQEQGQTELYWALLAYNWGPTNVQQHLRAGQGWGAVPVAKQNYVWEIMSEAAAPSARWWQEELQQPLP